jgi:hypothetical protein
MSTVNCKSKYEIDLCNRKSNSVGFILVIAAIVFCTYKAISFTSSSELPTTIFHIIISININEYQESSWRRGVERGQCVRLTISPLPMNRLSKRCGIIDISHISMSQLICLSSVQQVLNSYLGKVNAYPQKITQFNKPIYTRTGLRRGIHNLRDWFWTSVEKL